MALKNTTIQNLKAQSKAYKVSDGGGLYVFVTPTGGKLWRLKYRMHGKQKTLCIGSYPAVSMKMAQDRREEAKALLAKGIDPNIDKRRKAAAAAVSASNTFSSVASAYLEQQAIKGRSETTLKKNRWLLGLLEGDFGDLPVADIEAPELLYSLKKIEKRGKLESANRALSIAGSVFRFAISNTLAKRNPAADLRGALSKRPVKHHAAIIDPTGLAGLLRAIDGYEGFPSVIFALKLIPHLFPRPIELRHAEWSEIDEEKAIWHVGASKMKMRREHQDWPLSRQALAMLKQAKAFCNGSKYVFPSIKTGVRPISSNTINSALRGMGFTGEEMTGHGFRTTACTLLNESGQWSPDAIERALSHKDGNKVRAAYNRGGLLG